MKRVLISGFTTFDNFKENSSEIITQLFNQENSLQLDIRTVVLPVSFSRSFNLLKEEIENYHPTDIICLGLAANRTSISLEKVAINQIHCLSVDNDGLAFQDKLISETSPAAYFSSLPLEEMRSVRSNFPIEMSFSAGTFVCNYLMFKVLEFTQETSIRAGFIHLPHLGDNKDKIFESLKMMVQKL